MNVPWLSTVVRFQVVLGGSKMKKLALSSMLVAMLCVGFAGVTSAADNCDAAKNGVCNSSSSLSHGLRSRLHRKKGQKCSQGQSGKASTTPSGSKSAPQGAAPAAGGTAK
jgi:hypothetical protein